MHKKTIRGKIIYRHDVNGERGREWFTVTVAPDGTRTVRAHCEMDDAGLLRDVIYTVDGHWRPLDCFVRLTQNGAFVGSSWFAFGDTRIECEGLTATGGRISQYFDVAHRPPTFAPHPVMTDAWQLAVFDHSRKEKRQTITGSANPSPLADGGSGPMLSISEKDIEFLGRQDVRVPAGAFATDMYRLTPRDYPPFDLWVIDDDFTLAKIRWDHLSTTYELVELEKS